MKVPILEQKLVIPAIIAIAVISAGCITLNRLMLPGWMYMGTIELLLLTIVYALFAGNWSRMAVRYGIMVYVVTTGLILVAIKHTVLLGEFSFGNALGPFLNNVGLLLGLPWFVTVMFSYSIASQFNVNIYMRSLIGAGVAIVPTIFMFYNAEALDFFYWTEGFPPIKAYVTMFVAYFILHFAGGTMEVKSASPITKALYVTWFGFHFILFVVRLTQSA